MDFMIYDDASWHEDEFLEESNEKNYATHIGIFLKWCINRHLASSNLLKEHAEDVKEVQENKMTGAEFLLKNCAGTLSEEALSPLGNRFALHYYMGESRFTSIYSDYFTDYDKTFEEKLDTGDWKYESIYQIEDTKVNYERMAKMLDDRFGQFREWAMQATKSKDIWPVEFKTTKGLHFLHILVVSVMIFIASFIAIAIFERIFPQILWMVGGLTMRISELVWSLFSLLQLEWLLWNWGGAYDFLPLLSILIAVLVSRRKKIRILTDGEKVHITRGRKYQKEFVIETTTFLYQEKVHFTIMGAPVGKQNIMKLVDEQGNVEEIHVYGVSKKNFHKLGEDIKKAMDQKEGEKICSLFGAQERLR